MHDVSTQISFNFVSWELFNSFKENHPRSYFNFLLNLRCRSIHANLIGNCTSIQQTILFLVFLGFYF